MKNLLTIGSVGAKIAIVLTATVGGVALVGSSVFASLTATASNAGQSVTSATLKFTQASSGVVGITNGVTVAVAALAPGDTISRYIDVTNGGTLGAASWTLGLADGTPTALTTDATRGLQVAVYECTSAYNGSGVCPVGQTETAMYGTSVAPLSANSLLAAKSLTVAALDLNSLAVTHVKLILSLPASSEVTTNGLLPTPANGSIQGLISALTWTFTETQRTGTSTVA